MITAKPLGIQNYLLPSKPLGSDRRLSTVFLPEDFAEISSQSEIRKTADFYSKSRLKSVSKFKPDDEDGQQENQGEEYLPIVSENERDKASLTLSPNTWSTVVESLSQIRPLNQATMELSTGISPEIVFDLPGSNKSLVPMSKKDFGSVSTDSELPNSWSSLAELVENSLENIPEEEIIFTPAGFQRQNPDFNSNQRQSSGAALPPEDTYEPSVTQAVTLTSPYVTSEPELPENLDAIARLVYRRIIDRLQIERERNGRSYSGRLPW